MRGCRILLIMMKTNAQTSPTEPTIESLQAQIEELKAKIKWYEEQFRLSQQKRFGSSSEKTNDDQMVLPLFNEAEQLTDPTVPEPTHETITYRRKKKRGQREAFLNSLPTETIEYRLSDTEQACSCCGHTLHEMSVEIRKELAIIPAKVKVVEHKRFVYACRHCEQHGVETPIVTAPMPPSVFPKSLASPSIMAHIITQKYVEGLPLYRQEKYFERLGITLSRQTIANWVLYSAEKWLSVLYHHMHQTLLKQPILHADETTLQVLRESGRDATSKSYMWLYRTGNVGPPIVLYDYQPTRKGEHAKTFLDTFTGYLQVDGYSGYHKVPNVTLVGCWAHARRKFDEALKAAPPSAKGKRTVSAEGLQFCNQLYAIERTIKEASPEERYKIRLEKSKPILDLFLAWLQTKKTHVAPKSKLGEAIAYCLNQWEFLKNFLLDGRLEIDNNRSERAIKPFVIGRKNWLFSNTPRGAKGSAIVYSIVETAKANGLNPYEYLHYLFQKLPTMDLTDDEVIQTVLPWSPSLPDHCRVQTK
ncbi:transposase [Anoxybacillus vitaminiphilus]|uniref:Transposase n=2 Tax=Paranoxybacillus vitaminiphilus TaxID=581036 RepID=A0A327Y8Y0_9BACL|nr:transposase [Anoxybacillus vitaminiphilus]